MEQHAVTEFARNIALARRYQRRAVTALLPPKVTAHLSVIERELRALAVELLAPPAEPNGSDDERPAGSRRVGVE